MKRISVIFGTRPETIKLCPLVLAIKENSHFEAHVCVTGQHREMLDQLLEAFDVSPDVDLNLMEPNQSLPGLACRAMTALDDYLGRHKPDFVIVQGDTSTAFIAALAAYYHRIPVGHVEAGLRTRNKYSPFPEEVNRVLLSHIADYHFAPTPWAKENLLKERIPEERINVTGHRRESFGQDFKNICTAIVELARRFSQTAFVYPVHLNPNVQKPVFDLLSGLDNVYLIDPLGYLPFVSLMNRATIILTDSGGIQEEAPSLGKPVLVMRDTTERPEAVEAGTVKLVGTDVANIVDNATELLTNDRLYRTMAQATNPYGDGRACNRIVDSLAKSL